MPSRFLSKRLVPALHRDLIERFGGTHGLRDGGLLDSALAQPDASFGSDLLHPTVFDQAAAYLFHLCANHAFLDGNKRIAFAAMDTFLRLNGHTLSLSDDDAYEFVIAVATSAVDKDAIASRLAEACGPLG